MEVQLTITLLRIVEFTLLIQFKFNKGFEIMTMGGQLPHYDLVIVANNVGKDNFKDQVACVIFMNETSKLINSTSGHLIFMYEVKTSNETRSVLNQISQLQKSASFSPSFVIEYLEPIDTSTVEETIKNHINKGSIIDGSSLSFSIDKDLYLIYKSELPKLRNSSNSSISNWTWDVVEIYSIKNRTFIKEVDNIRTNNGSFDYYIMLQKNARRWNFQKAAILGVGIGRKGYEQATAFAEDNTTEPRFSGGFEPLLYQYLRDALNFTEVAVKGSGYIREGPGGTLTGMANDLNKGLGDICISSTEFLEYRISGPDKISYLFPTFKIGMKAFFKQPPASSFRDVFTSAFSLQLWLFLSVLWILICLSMSMAYRIYFRQDCENAMSWSDKLMSKEIVIWATGAICQQGWHFTPDASGVRIIFFFGWFTGFLCYIAYSAKLVSILAVEVIPIKTFEDLIHGKFFIRNDAHIPTTKYYVKGLQERGLIPVVAEHLRNVDISETISKIMQTTSPIISLTDSFYGTLQDKGFSERLICTFSEVSVGTRPVLMSMFVKRGNPLKGLFNSRILQMNERGFNHRMLRKYLIDTSVQCLRESSGEPTPLGPSDIFTAYAILMSGFVLGSVLVVVEQLVQKMRDSRTTFTMLRNRLNNEVTAFQEEMSTSNNSIDRNPSLKSNSRIGSVFKL